MSDTGSVVLSGDQIKRFDTGQANYLYCYDQSALVSVKLYKEKTAVPGQVHTLERFSCLNHRDFDEFEITNLSASNNTVRLFFGPGTYEPSSDRASVTIETAVTATIDDSTPPNVAVSNQPTVTVDDTTPVDVNIASGSVTLNENNVTTGGTPTSDVSCAASTYTTVVASSATTARVRVTSLSSNTDDMRICTGGNAGAATGTPLVPGQTWETQTSALVSVYNPKASAQTVAVEVETA